MRQNAAANIAEDDAVDPGEAGDLGGGGHGGEMHAPLATLSSVGAGPEGAGLVGLGADLPGGAGGKGRAQSGALILILVVAIAVGTLFLMRKFGLGGGLQFVAIKIDYPVEPGSRPLARDAQHERVMHDLQTSAAVNQVPLENLARNPFELSFASEAAPPVVDDGSSESARMRREFEEKMRLIDMTMSSLKLNSVITGAVPIARISGQPVKVGDRVGGDVFIVKAIHGRSVDLEAIAFPGKVYTLSLGER